VSGDPLSHYVTLPGGTRARYRDDPAATGERPTLVLLHGASTALESWDSWVERLRGRWRIIRVDLPGHGFTGKTVEQDYAVPGLVAFVDAFTGALGLDRPFFLAGHSMGGHVAWRFTLLRPELVAGLMLVAPGGIAPPGGPQGRAYRLAARPGGKLLLRFLLSRTALERGLKAVFHDAALVTPAMVERYWAMSHLPGNRAAAIARFAAPTVDRALVARLGEITQPTLILWGRDDPVFPPALADAFTAAMPQATLVTYDRCGHFPMEEVPDRGVADLERFAAKRRGEVS
jgi:pimeloyl-ACP methyl ester carboxylesterase